MWGTLQGGGFCVDLVVKLDLETPFGWWNAEVTIHHISQLIQMMARLGIGQWLNKTL